MNTLRNLAALWNLGLLAALFATLAWFFYSVFLRKIVRAKKISRARSRRLLREASARGSSVDPRS